MEADVGDGNAPPGHEAGDGGQVLEPAEDLARRRALDTHVREEGEHGAEDDGDKGQALLRRAREDLRRVSGDGETVCGARRE